MRQWYLEGRSQSHAEKPGLILVDSSVWIDFLSASPSSAGAELRRMIADAEPFALAGVIITEILKVSSVTLLGWSTICRNGECSNLRDFQRIEKRWAFSGRHVRKVSQL